MTLEIEITINRNGVLNGERSYLCEKQEREIHLYPRINKEFFFSLYNMLLAWL